MELSEWIEIYGYCAVRVLKGTDPLEYKNRIAFIEKTPRVRTNQFTEMNDYLNWHSGPKGDGQECGKHQPSRDWCDSELAKMGYVFPENA